MKSRFIYFLLLVAMTLSASATCDENTCPATDTAQTCATTDYIYTMPDVMAAFPDGDEALDSIIKARLTIPDDILAPIKEMHGKVKARCIVKCVIEANGTVGDAMIEKTTTADLFDNEALRVVQSLPHFIPARTFDLPVRSWMMIPVEFIYDFSDDRQTSEEGGE